MTHQNLSLGMCWKLFCRGYASMPGCKGNLTNEQKAKLRGIHMAIKS